MNTSPTAPLPLAAIVHADDRHDLEALLEQVARRLQYAGWHVAGLVHRQDHYANGNKRMQLHDLCSEQQFELSQDLGAASEACSLNPQALAQASAVLRDSLDGGAELMVINRFGQLEALGSGFAQEFAACLQAGVPVLTAVAARHEPAWQHFTGGAHAPLPAEADAVEQWCLQQLQARRASAMQGQTA